MMYIKDQYGNEIDLNPTFKFVGLPFQREYNSMTKSGLDGEIITSKPIMNSVNRSITGQLYGSTKEEVLTKRNELADFCSRGEIRVGYIEEGWYIKGQVTSFDHKYIEKSARYVADVSFTIKCDNPYQKADEVTEEWVVTPTNYPERIAMINPHPAANLRFGTFDTTIGEKINDESSFYPEAGYVKTTAIGDGFSFDCYRGFSISAYCSIHTRKFKVFIDGVFKEEVSYIDDESKANVRYSLTFADYQKHAVTIILTLDTLYVDNIYLTPADLPVLQNPGTVEDYPVMEVESVDTEAMFSPLGKTVGDADHPISIWLGGSASLPTLATATTASREVSRESYNRASFLNGSILVPKSIIAGNHVWATLGCNLKALQSPYYSMTVTEIKNHMQSILSEVWGYAEGAVELGDPSFESGLNGFWGYSTNLSQSTDWAKTGSKSLKIVTTGADQWASVRKAYENQAGKKLTAKLTIYNPPTGGTTKTIYVKWRDITNSVDLSEKQIVLSLGAEGTYELEAEVPENCDNVRVYIYPAFGSTEVATIYIDDVTVTAYGVELYGWNGSWTYLYRGHENDFPALFAWINDTASISQYINDGKIYFLVKSKYPSDGITSSAMYIDHCRLGTVMNYVKLGAEAIVNYGGNLLEDGWGEYFATKNYGQWGNPFNQHLYLHNGIKTVYPGQKVTVSYEGKRDSEAVKNGISPKIFFISYFKDGSYAGSVGNADQFPAKANSWERTEQTVQLLDDYPMGQIIAMFYRFPNTTLPGKVEIRNAALSVGDKIIKIQPQDLRVLEFSEDIVLTEGDLITADTKRREIDKNGERLYQLINQSFKFFPIMIIDGLNHFRTNHTGANMKIKLKYQPKWK